MLHIDLVGAVLTVVVDEVNFANNCGMPLQSRAQWINESDLVGRLRDVIFPSGNPLRLESKVVGSGNAGIGAMTHDLQFGFSVGVANQFFLEATYIRRIGGIKPTRGKTISDDLVQMMASPFESHVVAFISKMTPGGAIANSPYRLTDLLGYGQVAAAIQPLFGNIVSSSLGVPKWVLSSPLPVGVVSLVNGVERSVVGSPGDPLWAIVWSKQ